MHGGNNPDATRFQRGDRGDFTRTNLLLAHLLDQIVANPRQCAVLTEGLALGVGVTNRLTVCGEFQPYIHLPVGQPRGLS